MNLRRIALIAAVALLGTTGTALAQKPTVAVLGLEVVDDAGMDAKIAKLATSLTNALRKRAAVAGAGPYRLAPNSNKDLLEMKLLGGCDNEARDCMAAIGDNLKARFLIYGKIEQRKNGYQVTLKLLNVKEKNLERSTSELIGLDDTSAARVNEWGRRLYGRLTGDSNQGTITIESNVDNATVYINGEIKGSVVNGAAKISGLSEGTLELRVEADGYAPFSTEVSVAGGGTVPVKANLLAAGAVKDKGPSKPGGTMRILFWSTAAVAATGAVVATVSGLQVSGAEQDKLDAINAYQENNAPLDVNDACSAARSQPEGNPDLAAIVSACDSGESSALMANAMWGVTLVSAAAAGFFYYKGYMSPGKSSSESASLRGKKRPAVVVTPTVLPTYVGAGVQIEF